MNAGEKQINCSALEAKHLNSEFKLYCSDMIAGKDVYVFL
jgi:hypothetical protein